MICGRNIRYEDLVGFDDSRRAGPGIKVAGVDEAGRGALAGPVVAAAVICSPAEGLEKVRDSKLLSEPVREKLYDLVRVKSEMFAVGIVDPYEIDRINILNATLVAMKKAVMALSLPPAIVLVDGKQLPDIDFKAEAVIGGDRKSFSIAAASIVAKVTRDRIMREKDRVFPGYGFIRNKGYGTREHREAIIRMGKTEFHRKSFRVRPAD